MRVGMNVLSQSVEIPQSLVLRRRIRGRLRQIKYDCWCLPLMTPVLVLILSVALFSVAFGQPPTEEARQAWQRFKAQHGTRWQIDWDNELGRPKTLQGGRYRSIQGDAESVARTFLLENRELFQLPQNLSSLVLDSLKESAGDVHLTFHQLYRGLPVFNGGLD